MKLPSFKSIFRFRLSLGYERVLTIAYWGITVLLVLFFIVDALIFYWYGNADHPPKESQSVQTPRLKDDLLHQAARAIRARRVLFEAEEHIATDTPNPFR